MKIKFCGADRHVTGSRHLLTLEDGYQILMDCGMYQGRGVDTDVMNREFLFEPHKVDCVLISHAHIDHIGCLPRMVAKGFYGKIYCTTPTKELAKLLLLDSAYIQMHDLKYVNERRKKKGETLLEPLYSEDEVLQTISQMETIPYHEHFSVHPQVDCHYTNAAHILGSAAVHLDITENYKLTKLTFTGDIGRPNDMLWPQPESFRQADYIICESTYGNRLHPKVADQEERLLQIVQETCVMNQGKLIIPAFSVDRTQELIYALDRMKNEGKLPHIKVYVDSPLSIGATGLTRKYKDYYNQDLIEYLKHDPENDAFDFPDLYYISSKEQSMALNNDNKPSIIISASGMAEAGRVKHHIANNIEQKQNTILLVGYCTPESLGGRLKNGNKEVKIFGQMHQVNCRIENLEGYSAHGDYNEMLEYLSCQNPAETKKIFLVHGEIEAQTNFLRLLHEKKFKHVEIPELGDEFELV
ncbi:MAG: MBL fold metallo-hydrolase [Bacteroidota bacterium]|nr:MBL fold metallo-hydrolase [Bacteroidota bacterium]